MTPIGSEPLQQRRVCWPIFRRDATAASRSALAHVFIEPAIWSSGSSTRSSTVAGWQLAMTSWRPTTSLSSSLLQFGYGCALMSPRPRSVLQPLFEYSLSDTILAPGLRRDGRLRRARTGSSTRNSPDDVPPRLRDSPGTGGVRICRRDAAGARGPRVLLSRGGGGAQRQRPRLGFHHLPRHCAVVGAVLCYRAVASGLSAHADHRATVLDAAAGVDPV